eukprot:COSAG01_NODE_2067_length_8506_cov_221.825384_8_plen_141_part_00
MPPGPGAVLNREKATGPAMLMMILGSWLALGASVCFWPHCDSTAQHSTAHTVGTHLSRFRTSHRNVGVKISPVLAPYFTKNGCAPSVTSWGDYLARLFHNKVRSPLLETPPYTEETPPPRGGPRGPKLASAVLVSLLSLR